MSTTERYRNPLERDGTSQDAREAPDLDPSRVPVDQREVADLLVYATRLAEHLKFFDAAQGPTAPADGNWVDFVTHDVSALAAAIQLETDHDDEQRRLADRAEQIKRGEPADRPELFVTVLDPLWRLAGKVDRWHRDAVAGLQLHAQLERLIRSGLAEAVRQAFSFAARLEEAPLSLGLTDSARPAVSDFGSVWNLGTVEADATFLASGRFDLDDEVDEALRRVTKAFDVAHEAVTSLVREAPDHLAETLRSYPEHQPHMALFLAFLQLLDHPRDVINTFAARHLAFYYQQVLQLSRKPPIPDKVHLLFELTRGQTTSSLPAGTRVKAGKDATGVELRYGTDREIVINRASIDPDHGLRSVFAVLDAEGRIDAVHAATDADSADGLGAELSADQAGWDTFGSTAMPPARIGFAVASPMFRLAQGDRTVTITLQLRQPLPSLQWTEPETIVEVLAENITARASGADAWVDLELTAVTLDSDGTSLEFEVKASPTDPPIVPFTDTLDGGFVTTQPVVDLVFDSDGETYPHPYLKGLELDEVAITVDVEGMTDLLLENDVGVLDPAKPFHPFGPVPKVGSSFFIGSAEVFQKALTSLMLHLTWADLPQDRLSDYYTAYTGIPSDRGFEAAADLLIGGAWSRLDSAINLIPADVKPPPTQLEIEIKPTGPLPATAPAVAIDRLTPDLQRGFMRLQLEASFGHAAYPKLVAEGAKPNGTIPNPPYTPLSSGLRLDYAAAHSAGFSEMTATDFDDRVEQVFQVWPFGWREIFPVADTAAGVPTDRELIPDFPVTVDETGGSPRPETAEGTLYIGLKDLDPPQNLSLLIRVAEGSADPDLAAEEVVWSYLTAGRWRDFTSTEILTDETNGLLTSGIVRLAMPETMTDTDTVLLPTGLHWIKASVRRNSPAVSATVALHTQAVTASFEDGGNDPNHLARPLAAETISKLAIRESAVKKVTQPYSSFGGRMAEQDDAYFVRVSERLRHKNRAVTIYDYERLVLEHFPEIFKVKCINHTDRNSEYAPGHVRVIVVPDLRNVNEVDPLRPKASLDTLERIRRHLEPLSSDFVVVSVTNPDYEEVQVRFDVRFHQGKDRGFHTEQLNEAIIRQLSPWVHDDIADLTFGGKLHRSSLLHFVEHQHEDVDFVVNFRMLHTTAEGTAEVEEARASTSSTVLVSAREHVIGHDVSSCTDGPADATAPDRRR